jgi:hypothetical protein
LDPPLYTGIQTVYRRRFSALKKARSVPLAGKFVALVFWDAEGIWFIDNLEKGKTITSEYYSNFLTRLDEIAE